MFSHVSFVNCLSRNLHKVATPFFDLARRFFFHDSKCQGRGTGEIYYVIMLQMHAGTGGEYLHIGRQVTNGRKVFASNFVYN